MTDIIIALCCLCAGVTVGKMCASKYKERYLFYKSLCNFKNDLYSEVCFFRNSLTDLLKKTYISEAFNKFLQLHLNEENKNNSVDNLLFLSESEKNDVNLFFDKIGKSDQETQVKLCENFGKRFENAAEVAQSEYKKYGTLYKKTGLIIGIAAFVIIV